MLGNDCGARAAAVRSYCQGWRSQVCATSRLKSWWGNGNFPPVLDAASDLKTTAPACLDAEQEQACKCDMTAQDTPIWLPAVRPPLGCTGWEGDAPVTDAFGGEEGGLGQGQAQAPTCRQAHAAQRRVAGTCPTTHQMGTSWPGSRQHHPAPCHHSRALRSPAQSQASQGCSDPGKPPCPQSPSGCRPGGVLHRSLLHEVALMALSPPDQATLCKSKLIRLHGYRHRNMRCILSLSINALYHPIKLIKKQSSSSHQVPCLNIINFILWLMIVSADGEHAS